MSAFDCEGNREELQENIKLLEESTGNSIEYSDLSDDNAILPDDLSTIESSDSIGSHDTH